MLAVLVLVVHRRAGLPGRRMPSVIHVDAATANAAAIAVRPTIRPDRAVFAVLQQQPKRRPASAVPTATVGAGRRPGKDLGARAHVVHVLHGRAPASTPAAAAARHLRQRARDRVARAPGSVRPGIAAAGHHRLCPGLAVQAVDHLRDGRAGRDGGTAREEISAHIQTGRAAIARRGPTYDRPGRRPEESELFATAFRAASLLAHQERPVSTAAHPEPVFGGRGVARHRPTPAARSQEEPVHVGRLRHAALPRQSAEPVVAAVAAEQQ